MAARNGQKIKLLSIIEIFETYTDDDHPLSATEICEMLSSRGITAERKAIYDDIQQLIAYGYDIIKTRTPKIGFFLAERKFELPEICLLTDAVRTAKFISAKKTRVLVSKLDSMLSKYQASSKDKGIFIDSTSKCANEEIFYNIDTISRAISDNRKIKLKYGVKQLAGDRSINTVYKERTVSPYAMTWQDDHYYLICNFDRYDNLVNLRIDRMRSVNETDIPCRHFSEVSDYNDVFDVADYTKKLFGMFAASAEEITLHCSIGILEQITDRFSENIFIRNITDTHFDFSVKAAVSEALVTWIMNYGDKIEVLSPENLKNMIIDRSKKILNIYAEK